MSGGGNGNGGGGGSAVAAAVGGEGTGSVMDQMMKLFEPPGGYATDKYAIPTFAHF